MCRSRPGTGCIPRTSGRLRATPGPERLSVYTGHGSGFHILHTWQILASLEGSNTQVKHSEPTFLRVKFAIFLCEKVQTDNFGAVMNWCLAEATLVVRDRCQIFERGK